MAWKSVTIESVRIDLQTRQISINDDQFLLRVRRGREQCALIAYAVAYATKHQPVSENIVGLTWRWFREIDKRMGCDIFNSWGFSDERHFRQIWGQRCREPAYWISVRTPAGLHEWGKNGKQLLKKLFLADLLSPEERLEADETKGAKRMHLPEHAKIILIPDGPDFPKLLASVPGPLAEDLEQIDTASDASLVSDQRLRVGVKTGRHISIFNTLSKAPASLSSHLRVSDFQTLVEERTEIFVGRDHIFNAINDAIANPDFPSGYLVIKGEPGIGKTALAAELVKRHDYLHHFNVAVENIRSPRVFLANLCAQVIVKYGLSHKTLPPEAMQDSGFLSGLLAEVVSKTDDIPIVVVVDALDEADDSGLPISANRLCLPQDLPDRVFFIVTMREKDDDRLFLSRKKIIPLKDTDPRNMDDIRAYARIFIDKHATTMDERIQQWNLSKDQFVEVLAERSDGNFQYLRFVLPDILNGLLSASNIDNIKDLPLGLHAYYHRHWRMMKDQDPRHYSELQRPILCFLATAREPISIEQLAEWTQLPPHKIRDLIKEWREFLNERHFDKKKTLYHIYHMSFGEFLDEEEGLTEFHGKIANYARRKVEEMRQKIARQAT